VLAINNSNSQVVINKVYNVPWETWIYCGGVVNHVYGTVTLHSLFQYDKKGNYVNSAGHFVGKNLNSTTGEVFNTQYLTNQEEYNPDGGTLTWKFIYRLIGDRGTVYLNMSYYEVDPLTGIWNLSSWKSQCL